jgi:hypothetical protein
MGSGNSPIKRKVGTKAYLNGKPVMWDGKKWVPFKKHRSTNTSGNRLTSLNTKPPKSKKPPSPKPKFPTKAITKPVIKTPATKPPVTKVTPAPTRKPIPKPKSAKERAYSKDSRNREYRRLIDAGKVKEAEALGRKIHAEMYGKKKKKKTQSASIKAGYPGNRNY